MTMKSTILLVLIASVSISTSALADTYKVTEILDGDTIKVVKTQDNSSIKVRLACIDAPEANQPQGSLSTFTLKTFIPIGTEVKLNKVDTDKYGRTVAEVLKNNVNVNQSMLKKGQAVVYHKYLSNCPDGSAYIEAEKIAKDKKVGFWGDSTFIKPEEWRKGVRPVVSKPSRTATKRNSNNAGYVPGSCQYLRSIGLSRFTPGDANYTRQRDRDGDGIACE